jgi:hypothetical protein
MSCIIRATLYWLCPFEEKLMDGEEIIHLVPCSKGEGEWGTYTGTFAFLSEASHWPY